MEKDVEKVNISIKARMGFSNIVVALLNFLCLLGSLACIGMGIWLATRNGSECLRSLQWPVIGVGLFFFVFALIGILGALLRIKILLWLYLAVTLLIIVAVVGFVAFGFIVTIRGSGEIVYGKAYKDYYLQDYSSWLQHELRRRSHWAKIENCIRGQKVCQHLNYDSADTLFSADLSPLESGCCKPPTACNFTFVNATKWIPAGDANIYSDADCNAWNNDPFKLCYDCDACRAAVAENVRRAWTKAALACAVALVFFIVDYSLGCCAVRNDKNRYYEKRKVKKKSSREIGCKGKRQFVVWV